MNCYDCIHSRQLPGDAHLECLYIKSTIGRCIALLAPDSFTGGNVVLNNVGVENGWCQWPLNFDPIWVESCTHFEAKP